VTKVMHYSVIRIMPDVVRGEAMNVGVVVWDDETREGAFRLSRGRQRLRHLGLVDTSFLTDFQQWMTQSLSITSGRLFSLSTSPDEPWSLDLMAHLSNDWAGMIQFSEPRPTGGTDAESVLSDIYDRFVLLNVRQAPEQGRERIRRNSARLMRNALRERFGDSPPVDVKVGFEVDGAVDSHVFDIVVANHITRNVLITPNFANPKTIEVRRDLEAAAWSVQDVRNRDPQVAFGLLNDDAARPALRSRVDALAGSLPVRFISTGELGDWAVESAAAR
jgi:Protein of unknown function (DUF3037)